MYPKSVECDLCGGAATIIAATPIYDDAGKLLKSDGGENVSEYSCRVECPACGVRIQVVRIASP